MISLHNYSSGKVLPEQIEEPIKIDYVKESLLRSVKTKWEWQLKGGPGNLMSTMKGRVIVRNCEGEPVRVVSFSEKRNRNQIVTRMMHLYAHRKYYTVNVEFN